MSVLSMSETSPTARLGPDTLLFTDVTQCLQTRIGRSDASPVTSEQLDAMDLMFTSNGGKTVKLDGLLILRAFTDRVLGDGSTRDILEEITAIETLDAPVFLADYEEDSNDKTYKVHALHKHPAVQKARNMAAMWTMQDHPLVAQTGQVVHSNLQGRKVCWCMCLKTCQLQWKEDNVELYSGDVCVKLTQS